MSKHLSTQTQPWRPAAKPIRRGDIYYADLEAGVGSEQNCFRPVLIIQNNLGNRYSPTVIITVITGRIEDDTKPRLPTHCPLSTRHGLKCESIAMLEQLRTIDKTRLLKYIGTIGVGGMTGIDKALAVSVGLKYAGRGEYE